MTPEGEALSPADHTALSHALSECRAESAGRAEQLDSKLADGEPWEDVAAFAAYCVQIANLGLQPWQDPPCVIDLEAALREPFGYARGLREGGEMLRRLLDAGLSAFEPDPMRALAEVETRPPARMNGSVDHAAPRSL